MGSNNKFDKNVIIFGVDNSSSSHTVNQTNDFLVLGERSTYGICGSFGAPLKSLVLILVKQKQSFVWVCIIMMIIVIYL